MLNFIVLKAWTFVITKSLKIIYMLVKCVETLVIVTRSRAEEWWIKQRKKKLISKSLLLNM